ncbi:ABC transporter ATP-binding protein [Dysgonomonas sp. 521]|uniref:ABC transporter ATP-binding protein n=1 Tax=Dysgonomonas sp. 521 TaxID=2302932 RepID=UPI0013D62F58|nr:ABC transporter ATP-binding protein [Dysgonomonas sp. 521]NDV94306.1 ABC transporter ATP-binding protein [Dysgonomonas sp. 521]
MNEVVIKAQNISIGYAKSKQINVLYENLSFNLYKGELVCLIGANGAGKSTLLRTISASQPALKGNILFDNQNITSLSEKELSRQLGLVLTDKTSTGGLLVRELVELGRYPYTGFFGQLTDKDRDIVRKAMQDVGISHKAQSYMAELSDGERQKAMIAKALAQECPVVLLDEPTAFLDIESRIEIMNLLHNLAMYQDKTILLSTHDIDMALLLADRLWLLSKDKGLASGVTEDIIFSGKMDGFFKGENIVFDRYTGNFLPKRANDKKVHLKAHGILYHWTKNILERNGFSLAKTGDENVLFTVLSQETPPSFSIVKNNNTIELYSFEQLAAFLKDMVAES